MRIIDSAILAQLAARELRPFQLLEMTLDGGTYRYTDCDVPIGAQVRKQIITDGPVNHGLSLADGVAFASVNGLDLSPYGNSDYLLTLIDSAGKTATGYIEEAGPGETLGSELFDDDGGVPDFEDTFTDGVCENWILAGTGATGTEEFGDFHGENKAQRAAFSSGAWNNQLQSRRDGNAYTTFSVTAGKLYKVSFWIKMISGTLPYVAAYNGASTIGYLLASSVTAASWTQYTGYFTAKTTEWMRLQFYGGYYTAWEMIVDDVSVKEVTIGSELLSNTGFEDLVSGSDDDDTADNFTTWIETNNGTGRCEATASVIHSGSRALKLYRGTGTSYLRQAVTVTPGKLYRLTVWTRGDGTHAGKIQFYDQTNSVTLTGNVTTGVTGTAWTEKQFFCTIPVTCTTLRVYLVSDLNTEGAVAYFDDVSFKEVLTCAATGVHIVLTAGGSTRNWASIESGFDYNDDEYIATLSGERYEPRGFSHDGALYSLGRIVDKVRIEIDNVDQALSAEFVGGDPGGSGVSLKEVVLDGDNLVIGHPITWFAGTIDDWDLDEDRLSINIVGPNYAWSRRTVGRHPSSCRWREFKGNECGYSGGAATCNRTYARCAALGNTDNFGGFRWLPNIEDKEIVWGKKA